MQDQPGRDLRASCYTTTIPIRRRCNKAGELRRLWPGRNYMDTGYFTRQSGSSEIGEWHNMDQLLAASRPSHTFWRNEEQWGGTGRWMGSASIFYRSKECMYSTLKVKSYAYQFKF